MEITIANVKGCTAAQPLINALEGKTYMDFTVMVAPVESEGTFMGSFDVIVETERGDVTKEQMTDMVLRVLSSHIVGDCRSA